MGMSRFALAFAAIAISTGVFAATAEQPPAPVETGLKPWVVRPSGVARMMLAGGLSTTDMTTFRMYYPSTFKVASGVHFHAGTEHVIVLKGSMRLGFGTCPDPAKALTYGPGSFMSIPAGAPHYEWINGPVELQVTSVGPMSITVPVKESCSK
jgi:mannose-6-phosphate isomerase-like protein (cupin superfamily)